MGGKVVKLFDKVKSAILGQTPKFCSRETSVTVLGNVGLSPDTTFTYFGCDGKQYPTTYGSIRENGGYIPDCVQGGSPVEVINQGKDPIRLFVQYGTTNCDTPPPTGNYLIEGCGSVLQLTITSPYNLQVGGVYNMTFAGPTRIGCYTVLGVSVDRPQDTLSQIPINVGDCNLCRRVAP